MKGYKTKILKCKSFLLERRVMKKTCSNCKWLKGVPFSDELFCTNGESEYADCPTEQPEKDTCDEWEGED